MNEKLLRYSTASLDDSLWCDPKSGVDVWRLAQRLARHPREVRSQYMAHKFDKLANVTPGGDCLESFHEGCRLCSPVDGSPPRPLECTKPRTWVIGQSLHFANPVPRTDGVITNKASTQQVEQETKTSRTSRTKKSAVVAPAPRTATNAWTSTGSLIVSE